MAKHRSTRRSTQRHRALDVLFEADERDLLAAEDLLRLLSDRQKVSTAQTPIQEFGSQIVEAYAANGADVDTMIEASSEDWALGRMASVDRNILRGATAELMFVGTHRGAVIAEWSALARELSTARSVNFVMGILNRVADIFERESRGEGPVFRDRVETGTLCDDDSSSDEDSFVAPAEDKDEGWADEVSPLEDHVIEPGDRVELLSDAAEVQGYGEESQSDESEALDAHVEGAGGELDDEHAHREARAEGEIL